MLNYRALIIGIDDYKDRRIPDLKTAVNDARAMPGVITDKYYLSLYNEETKMEYVSSVERIGSRIKYGCMFNEKLVQSILYSRSGILCPNLNE